jgi:hypothetical protein
VYQKDLFPMLLRLQLYLLNQVVMLNLLRLVHPVHSIQKFQQLLRRLRLLNYIEMFVPVVLSYIDQRLHHYYLDRMLLFDPLDLKKYYQGLFLPLNLWLLRVDQVHYFHLQKLFEFHQRVVKHYYRLE